MSVDRQPDQPRPSGDPRAPKINGMIHVGWWSDHNGWTPCGKGGESKRAAAFMRHDRGDVPVYVQAADKRRSKAITEARLTSGWLVTN